MTINFNDVIVVSKNSSTKPIEIDMGFRYSMKIKCCKGSFDKYKDKIVYKIIIRDDAYGRIVFKSESSLNRMLDTIETYFNDYKRMGIEVFNETDIQLPDNIKSTKRKITA